MFEKKQEPLISREAFIARLARSFAVTLGMALVSLLLGSLGYHYLGELSWIDASLNAAMILTGMGPVDRMPSTSGKLFASGYALYSGVAFISMVGVLVAPVFHRILHAFHMDIDEND